MGSIKLHIPDTWTEVEPYPTTLVPDLPAQRADQARDLINSLMAVLAAMEKGREILAAGGTIAPASVDPYITEVRHCSELTRWLVAEDPLELRNGTAVDLAATLKALNPLLKLVLPERVRLEMNLPETFVQVHASPALIHQITCNLILNARDAITTSGTITISLEVPRPDDGDRPPSFRMTDDGRGIPAEALVKIFRPYFYNEPGGRREGSALSRAKLLIERLGGSIDVEYEADRGTTYIVHFPTLSPEFWPC